MLKYLKKYGYCLAVSKSQLYKNLSQRQDIIKEEGFDYHLKTEEDLFKYEIIVNGIINKNQIDKIYYGLCFEEQDALQYLNYEEKQIFFQGAIGDEAKQMIHFQNIYIPYLEEFINERYLHSYMMLTLKQHQLYIKDYPRSIDQPFVLYGYQPMMSDFSSLVPIGKDESHYYFYHDEFKRVFLFNKNDYKIDDEIYLTDKYSQSDIDVNKVYELIELYCQNKKDFLDKLYQEKYICEKVYKKILKKLK